MTIDGLLQAVRAGWLYGINGTTNAPPPSATVATIAAQATAPAGADLIDRLRQLCILAEQSDAGSEWVAGTADGIVDAVLALQAFQRDHIDPRRRVSLARAARMANTVRTMREAGRSRGDTVAALRLRESLSRGHVYALLRMNVCGDITVQKAG